MSDKTKKDFNIIHAMRTCLNCGERFYWHDACCDNPMTIEQQLKKAQEKLAISVCKECKCEENTMVNHDLVDRNIELREKIEKIKTYSLERWVSKDMWDEMLKEIGAI